MIKTLIIEDEQPATVRLEKLMLELELEIEVLAKLDSVEASLNWLKKNAHPDLLMLDIQLADGLSFDIFKHMQVESFVIFTTAYDEYAIKAFELNSIDYLLKPIKKEKLASSLEKFKKLKDRNSPQFDVNELVAAIESKKTNYKKRFAISAGTRIKSIETDEVASFTSIEKSTFINTYEGKTYAIDFSLDKLESLLDPDRFFRVNRQCIINFSAIEKISVLSKSRIEVKLSGSAEEVMVSTAKAHGFRLWLDK